MAGVSTKEIKTRIRSMESTRQITRAMEMVASAKLRKAQVKAMACRPYFETLYRAMWDIVDTGSDFSSPFLQKKDGNKAVFVLISGDRGLAGGYNNNVQKLLLSQMEGKDAAVLPMGKKGADYLKSHEIKMLTEQYTQAETVSLGDCFSVAKQLCKGFKNGEIDEVFVIYTKFRSVLSQEPMCLQLLPLQRSEEKVSKRTQEIVYEPDGATVFDAIVPEYLGGVLYGALCESRASEQAARRTAMDAATENAGEMIDALSLQFNRARQAAITQEITEIVAGSQ
ncbi:MAG: ATP synthase F1 subunit gamma [Oscillospiraceae bacterium]|nr:ATP synthase F1 subunit gamma [Oscillospiraceae bacterium]